MSKQDIIRERFESALVDGLKGTPVVSREGDLAVDADGVAVLAPPEASFLSVVRAYLKDLVAPKEERPAVPVPGQATGVLKDFINKNPLPFGSTRRQ